MSDRRQRVMELLEATLAADAEQRPDVLHQLADGDETLRREVELLLTLEDEADDFLAVPAVPPVDTLKPETRVGPYRIVEMLDHGGMGSVYRATREHDFEKPVAIKLIRRDLFGLKKTTTAEESRDYSPLGRFHTERQILARASTTRRSPA